MKKTPVPPPPSPRKKRRILRESEESQGDMSIERYLLRSDPFRSTSASKPLPHPLIVRSAVDTPWNKAAEHVSPIVDQLIKNHIPEYLGGPCNLSYVSKPGYPGGDEPKLTWFVSIFHNSAGRGFFGPLKDEIWEHLAVNGLSWLDVEVVDPGRCFGPSIFPIAPGHPAVAVYKEIREELRSTLQRKLQRKWRGMCLFHLGKSLEASNPTIVVLVSPETVHNWAELESTFLEKIRSKAGSDVEMNVEFLPGDCCDAAVEKSGKSYLGRMETHGLPAMDHSIETRHEVGGGTLGGFITLDIEGAKRKGLLTNYHVVRPSSKAPDSIITQADRHGSSRFTTNDTDVNVFYLAQKDVQATQEAGRMTLEVYKGQVREYDEVCEKSRMAGREPTPPTLKRTQMLRSEMNKVRQKLQRVESMPRHLGTVLVSSGRTLCSDSNRILDWAFVELTGSNAKLHYRPNILPTIQSSDPRYIAAGTEVVAFSNLEAGGYYVKNGRATGATEGFCNDWQDEERTRYNINGKKIEMHNGWTEEFVIAGDRNRPFSDAGDSGSWVLSNIGDLSGLLYGSFRGECGPPFGIPMQAGLATCMNLVRASMNEKTKHHIHGKPIGEGGELEFFPST